MIEPKYGIVAMLDALGARTLDSKGASNFIESRDALLKKLEGFKESLKTVADSMGIHDSQTGVAKFADTIVLTWHLSNDEIEYFLVHFGAWLRLIIMMGMQQGLLLRGAVSVGEFTQQDETILGPAISEAAEWYEQAQWIGVVATPSCGSLLSSLAERLTRKNINGEDLVSLSFRQYSVPLKDKKTLEMWALCWPIQFWIQAKKDGLLARRAFMETLSKYPVPSGTEDKFANTIKYFDWCIIKLVEQLQCLVERMPKKG